MAKRDVKPVHISAAAPVLRCDSGVLLPSKAIAVLTPQNARTKNLFLIGTGGKSSPARTLEVLRLWRRFTCRLSRRPRHILSPGHKNRSVNYQTSHPQQGKRAQDGLIGTTAIPGVCSAQILSIRQRPRKFRSLFSV